MFGKGRINLKKADADVKSNANARYDVSLVEFETNTIGDKDSLSREYSGIEF